MNTINKERVAKLIAALESGEYEQGYDYLNRGGKFCCMGVACDIHANETGGEWRTIEGRQVYWGGVSILPTEVAAWYGFERNNRPWIQVNDHRVSVYAANDDLKLSFSEIAQGLKELITEKEENPSE